MLSRALDTRILQPLNHLRRSQSFARRPVSQQAHAQLSPMAAEINADINGLGAGLLAAVHSVPPNLPGSSAAGTFVSPFSISLALVLLLNGANEGSTVHKQLEGILAGASGSCNGIASTNQQYEALMQQLEQAVENSTKGGATGEDAPLILNVATSVWARPPLAFKSPYLDELTKHLRSSAHELTGAAPVNDWVSHETRGKIKDLLDEGAVQQALAVLVSAVYFKGTWERAFEADRTQGLPFHLSSGREVQASMMFKKFPMGQAGYVHEVGQYQGARLPYKGGQFAAVALLPDAGAPGGVKGLLKRLADEPGLVGALRWSRNEVLVWMPRFKLESAMSLKGALQQLGVKAPFQPSHDFGGMLQGESELVVDDVVHKVFIEVNEKGTEAAAATAVMMMRSTAFIPDRPPPELHLDRPFLFGVQHVPTGTLLFVGVVECPEPWQGSHA